jgi:hypothetical protein
MDRLSHRREAGMARARLISRSLGSSRKFFELLHVGGDLGEFCQVLFPLLVANSDDWGRMSGDAFTVKNVVLPSSPRSEGDFSRALDLLADVDLVDRYQIGGRVYLQIKQFEVHQANLHKRTESRIPESPGISAKYRTNLIELNLTELNLTEEKRTTHSSTNKLLSTSGVDRKNKLYRNKGRVFHKKENAKDDDEKRRRAEVVYRRWGWCRHTPRCASRAACIDKLMEQQA